MTAAYDFDRASAEYVHRSSGTLPDLTGDCAIGFWGKIGSNTSFSIYGLFGYWIDSNNWIRLRVTDLLTGFQNVIFDVQAGASYDSFTGTKTLATGTWYYFIIRHSGGTWTVEIGDESNDAVLEDTLTGLTLSGSPGKIAFGNIWDPNNAGAAHTTDLWDGGFGVARLFEEARSLAEMVTEQGSPTAVDTTAIYEDWPTVTGDLSNGAINALDWTEVNTPTETTGPDLSVDVTGTVAITDPNDTSAASGTVEQNITGTVAITDPNDTSAASGGIAVAATVAITDPNDVSAATGAATGGTVATITNITGATTIAAPAGISLDAIQSVLATGDWQTALMLWDMGDGTIREGFRVSHVYETPGTYTVTLTVVAEDGTDSTDSLEFTVQNYAPATITYVSGTGNDTTGNGSVSTPYRTLQKACEVQSGTGANKGIYLERGYTYTLAVIGGDASRRTVLPTDWSGTATQPFVIQAYGSGADPIVSAPDANGGGTPFAVFNQFQTFDWWTVQGIDWLGPYTWGDATDFGYGCVIGSTATRRHTWIGCTFRNFAIGWSPARDGSNIPTACTLKDCEFTDNSDNHLYSEWQDGLGILTSTFDRVWASHMMRLPFVQRYYGYHNTWHDGNDTRTTMKFHGGVFESVSYGARWIWVDGDICYPKSESNAVVVSVHNFDEDQKHTLEDVCFQNMQFLTDATNLAYTNKACFEISARRVVVRNNRCSFDTGAAGNGFMVFTRLHGYPYVDTSLNPRDITIANNSVYIRNGGGSNMWNALLAFGDVNGPGTTGTRIETVSLQNNAFHVVGSWTATGMVSQDTNNSVADQLEDVTEQHNISNCPASSWAYKRNLSTLYTLGSTWDAVAGGDKGTGSLAATTPGFADGQAGDFAITTGSACFEGGKVLARVIRDSEGNLCLASTDTSTDVGAHALEAQRVPSIVTATAIDEESIQVDWDDRCGNEDGFAVQRAPDVGGNPGTWATVATAAANATSYIDSGLLAATTYHYRVRPVLQDQLSVATSPSDSATTTGTGGVTGTVSITDPADVSAGTAVATDYGTVAVTDPNDVSACTAVALSPVFAIGAMTDPVETCVAAGAVGRGGGFTIRAHLTMVVTDPQEFWDLLLGKLRGTP